MINPNKSTLVIWCVMLFIILTAIVCVILFLQKKMFFHPWHDEVGYKELQTMQNFQELKIPNEKGFLRGWIRDNTSLDEKAPLLIFCGGNAQNSSNTALYYLKNDIYKYFEGYNVLLYDYPEYGLSDGKISDKTLLDSAIKVYDYAKELDCVDEKNIVVMGFSIGTGAATYLASQRAVNGLILLAPYDEALSLYNNTLNIFHGPMKLLAKYKLTSNQYAKDVNVAPLIFASQDDEIISHKFSEKLSECFNEIDEFVLLNEGVKHNYYFTKEVVRTRIHAYLQERLNQK